MISGGLPTGAVTLKGVDTVNKTKLLPVLALISAFIFVALGATSATIDRQKIKYKNKRWI